MASFLVVESGFILAFEHREGGLSEGTAVIIRLLGATSLQEIDLAANQYFTDYP
jgi:hypothetical protein